MRINLTIPDPLAAKLELIAAEYGYEGENALKQLATKQLKDLYRNHTVMRVQRERDQEVQKARDEAEAELEGIG